MSFSMARCAQGDQILGRVIAQSTSSLNVVDLKTIYSAARLATPVVSLQDIAAELAIRFRFEPQVWTSRTDPYQSVTCTCRRSWFLSRRGRPMTRRGRQGERASWLPA